MEIRGKRVLLMGLGILGGGVATARFLFEHGARITITDLKNADDLKISLKKLADIKDGINFVLGEHRKKDFLSNDIIVVNPDVTIDNKFVKLARDNHKQIENELSLFYKFCPTRNIVVITGTRGKTTTVNWASQFIKSNNPKTVILGNSPASPFLASISDCDKETSIVVEVPSFQLELSNDSKYAPHIAIITNLYRDHINRHKSLEEYAGVKANIFKNQKENDFLILNNDNEWTPFFVNCNPKSKILYFSTNILPKEKSGAYIDTDEDLYFKIKGKKVKFVNIKNFKKEWGGHNIENLMASSLAAYVLGITVENLIKSTLKLPQIKFRQEKVYCSEKMDIYNDTTATSPEATIAAISRFGNTKKCLVLITGGTDRELEFYKWADSVKKFVNPANLFLLSGSATEKMKSALGWNTYNEFENLKDCLEAATEIVGGFQDKGIILFSPSSKSFEKFKNEFDRGEKFNTLLTDVFKEK